jgi:hypothetical protein
MIKRILCISLIFTGFVLAKADNNELNVETLNTIRVGFYVAVEDEDTTVSLMNFIKEEFSKDQQSYPSVILAYYAALEGLRGRHASNPLSKFVHVSKAVEMMNQAVDKTPDLLEIRFLRFSFFHQIPGLFGVANKVEGDLEKTISLLEKRDYGFVDKKQQEDMVDYLLDYDRLLPEQRSRLEILKEELNATP